MKDEIVIDLREDDRPYDGPVWDSMLIRKVVARPIDLLLTLIENDNLESALRICQFCGKKAPDCGDCAVGMVIYRVAEELYSDAKLRGLA